MFDVITRAKAGRATLLTTHVMEDADALSTRVGVMARGRLAVVGSAAHLKHRFGRGYQVEVHTNAEPAEDAAEAIREALAGASSGGVKLVESHNGHLRYVAEAVSLAAAFRALESAKSRWSIVDYAVSETTLEQVFLALSNGHDGVAGALP